MVDKPLIHFVEDDPEIRSLVQSYLERHDLKVEVFPTGAAFERASSSTGRPDLIILDIMLPGEDGLSICRRLRAASTVPILFLSAKGDDIDRIVGLEMGADNYLTKPFNPRELLARIKSILRRADVKHVASRRLRVGGHTVDLDARSVRSRDGADVVLTAAEFDLLECFVTRPGRVLSRDQLMTWTRGRASEALDRTIDVQVSRLRKRIETGEIELIKTIRNSGYILVADVEEI